MHVSSFVVTCGYVWSCLAQSRAACCEEVREHEWEHFIFAADCRARLDPPIPDNILHTMSSARQLRESNC